LWKEIFEEEGEALFGPADTSGIVRDKMLDCCSNYRIFQTKQDRRQRNTAISAVCFIDHANGSTP
jgi:hypothetical protein